MINGPAASAPRPGDARRCNRCAAASWARDREFTIAETAALASSSGATRDSVGTFPVVAAVLIPRIAFAQLGGMTAPDWVELDWPIALCPFASLSQHLARRAILRHEAAWRAPSGARRDFSANAEGAFALVRCESKCPRSGPYFLRLVDLGLPRLRLDPTRGVRP